MAGWEENRALLLLETMKLRLCPASSAGPALMAVAQPATLCAPESSATVWSAPFVKLGASLTATTVILKLGGTENNDGLSTVRTKFSVWDDSSEGPALMAVAQLGTLCAPASSRTV